MKKALFVLGGLATVLGFILAVITLWFAFGFFLRILAFVVGLLAFFAFCGYVAWSWWTECVVNPYRAKRDNKRRRSR